MNIGEMYDTGTKRKNGTLCRVSHKNDRKIR